MPLNETAFLTYQAKRDAEMAPGVGERYTDIGVITDKGFDRFDGQMLEGLSDAYNKLSEAHRNSHTVAQEDISSLFQSFKDR